LIKKVCIFEKDANNQDKFKEINPDFLTFIQGKDAKLKTLANLFKEKSKPKQVIILIEQCKKKVDSYKLTDEDKKRGWQIPEIFRSGPKEAEEEMANTEKMKRIILKSKNKS
ncbi:37_t:CDS:2, partial [Gigaspora rosea]